MSTFRPKQNLIIEGIQWLGGGRDAPRLPPWVMQAGPETMGSSLQITTIRGRDRADPTDYVVRVSGGILILKRAEFEALFISAT